MKNALMGARVSRYGGCGCMHRCRDGLKGESAVLENSTAQNSTGQIIMIVVPAEILIRIPSATPRQNVHVRTYLSVPIVSSRHTASPFFVAKPLTARAIVTLGPYTQIKEAT